MVAKWKTKIGVIHVLKVFKSGIGKLKALFTGQCVSPNFTFTVHWLFINPQRTCTESYSNQFVMSVCACLLHLPLEPGCDLNNVKSVFCSA